MIRQLKKYIKDVATCFYLSDADDIPKTKEVTDKIRKRALSMIRNYCSLRLKLLKNEKIEEIEIKVAQALIKVAIKSAAKEFEVSLPDNLDEYVDKVTEPILSFVHTKRGEVFTTLLELTDAQSK